MSSSAQIQPPTGGWNTRDALADMPADHAVILDNWFPDNDTVELRKGFSEFATGMSGNIETLMNYAPQTGTDELFAANGSSIFDVSGSGAVGSAVVTGLSNARFQFVNIGTSGGQFLFCVNGADAPRNYNGTTWATTPAITGPTAANLIWCNLHQRRLWVGEANSLTAYYLAADAIGGAASSFSLASVARLGGYIMAMGTWTRDAGDGQDDVAIFITSEGEAIVYSGTDPASASTWALIGVFRIGKPIGRRCIVKAGGDLLIITDDGILPLSLILSVDRSQSERVALSAQIAPSVNEAVRNYGSTFGWELFLYPFGTMLIMNVPQGSGSYHQYVFNTISGAPCRFTGVNAICWALKDDDPYFGGTDGKVYKFDSGSSDNGENIEGDAQQAFNYFKSPGTVKAFKRVEVIFQSDGNPNAAIDLNTDFILKTPSVLSQASPSSSALWDTAKWDEDVWGGADQVYRGWRSVRGSGRSAAIRVRVSTTSGRPKWLATSYNYVRGGQL